MTAIARRCSCDIEAKPFVELGLVCARSASKSSSNCFSNWSLSAIERADTIVLSTCLILTLQQRSFKILEAKGSVNIGQVSKVEAHVVHGFLSGVRHEKGSG